jgi:hypothetical protein
MSRLVARATGVPMASSKAAVPAGADLQVPMHAGNGDSCASMARARVGRGDGALMLRRRRRIPAARERAS